MAALKYSRQREAIKVFLAGREDHPTADTVYTNLQKQYPNISLGTVYRNLALLSTLGEIQKITTGYGADRFDGRTAPHNHFVCKKCQAVIDLKMENDPTILDTAARNFGGHIDGYVMNFYGVCEKCLKEEESKH
jgi:Fur family peroxide stress response transcriptional regulator